MNKTVLVTLRITPALKARLDKTAAEMGATQSQLIRKALARYLKRLDS